MPSIKKLLDKGDLRSAGNSAKVVERVLQKPELFEELVQLISSDKPATCMRAADAVEKITRSHPQYLKPYKKLFMNQIGRMTQKEIRWHTAQILPRLTLTKNDRKRVYELMIGYLQDKSSIVRTFAMQALADIALQDGHYHKKVRKIISEKVKTGTPAMQSRGKKLLQLLDSEK